MLTTDKHIYHREPILCPCNLQELLLLLSSINSSLTGFQKVQVIERTLLLHQSPIQFPTIRQVLLLYDMNVSHHRPFLPGTYPEPSVIPTAQASSFRLQYFLCYVWCSKYIIIIIFLNYQQFNLFSKSIGHWTNNYTSNIIIRYVCLLSQAFLPGTSLEPAVIPTTQASSFTLQYFPYYVWCSKYSCLL